MYYFYLTYASILLLLSDYKFKYKIVLICTLIYILLLDNLSFFSVEVYTLLALSSITIISYCLWDSNQKILSFLELSFILLVKFIELVFIINPLIFNYTSFIYNYIFKLDDVFIVSILYLLLVRDIGYNPLKVEKDNFRKYLLTLLTSYLSVLFLI